MLAELAWHRGITAPIWDVFDKYALYSCPNISLRALYTILWYTIFKGRVWKNKVLQKVQGKEIYLIIIE